MCCGDTETFDLPPAAIEAIAHYRRLRAERGNDWGDERLEFVRWASYALVGPSLGRYMETGDLPGAVRGVLAEGIPSGVVVVTLGANGANGANGGSTRAAAGPLRLAIAGNPTRVDIVLDSATDTETRVTIGGREIAVEPHGVGLRTIEVDASEPAITVAGLTVDVVRPAAAAELRLTSPACARWSVTDATGGAWFPPGVLRKWDFHGRPFFHGHDVTVAVPAGPLTVACARGLEFDRAEATVEAPPGETTTVQLDPPRLFDPAAAGWYGGDLHVHLNYSGDLVCAPADAARMQQGEGLHLLNLVAGNFTTSVVYDRDLFEQTVGRDLPWSTDGLKARMGVEYRNDLLGHVHALGPTGPPARYQTGHDRSEHPDDWPPNRVACEDLRALGATVGYAHPAGSAFPADGSTDAFFGYPRSVEARELVADAALGVVDSVDVISPFHHKERCTSTTGCCRAGCGSRRPPARTCSSRSPAPAGVEPARLGSRLRGSGWRAAVGRGLPGRDPRRSYDRDQRAVARPRGRRARAGRGARPPRRRPGHRAGPLHRPRRRRGEHRRAGRGGRGAAPARSRWNCRSRSRRGSPRSRAAKGTRTRWTTRSSRPRRSTSTSRGSGSPGRPTPAGAWTCSTRWSASWQSTATSRRPPARPGSATSSLCWTRPAPTTAPSSGADLAVVAYRKLGQNRPKEEATTARSARKGGGRRGRRGAARKGGGRRGGAGPERPSRDDAGGDGGQPRRYGAGGAQGDARSQPDGGRVRVIRTARVSMATATAASIIAKWLPMQFRGPPENGRYAYLWRAATASGSNRSGSNGPAAGQRSGCRCIAHGLTTTTEPGGIA